MSGLVQAFLTDHELDILLVALAQVQSIDQDAVDRLAGKLRGMAQSVSCKPCREGGSCRVGSVTPADVIA